MTCFSFYATKPLTTGEGGMVTTHNKAWAEQMRSLSLHGLTRDAWGRYEEKASWYYEIRSAGYKYNMNDIAAAIGLVQLGKFETTWQGRQQIAARYPFIRVAGILSPPVGDFSREVNEEIVEKVNRSGADVLWVGLTAPKQEIWIEEFKDCLRVKAAFGIGAEFDYFAGKKKRPPHWMRSIGLQWFHRLITEPRRTWRRHLISMPTYLFHVVRSRLTSSGRGRVS